MTEIWSSIAAFKDELTDGPCISMDRPKSYHLAQSRPDRRRQTARGGLHRRWLGRQVACPPETLGSWRMIPVALGVGLLASFAVAVHAGAADRSARDPDLANFRLVDAAGRAYSIDSFAPDTVLAIYFGYTTCLRACPVALDNIAAAMDGLGAKSASVQPVFVDMDSERVDPVNLRMYHGIVRLQVPGADRACRIRGGRREIVQGSGRTPAVQRRSERLRDDAPFTDFRDAARRSPALVAARHEYAGNHRGRAAEGSRTPNHSSHRASTSWAPRWLRHTTS